MKSIIIVGSFLSKQKGTQAQGEKLYNSLKNNFRVFITSKIENRVFRIINICASIIIYDYNIAIIEVFSDRAFLISRIATKLISLRNKKIILILHGGRLNEFHIENRNIVNSVFKRADILLSPSKFLIHHFSNNGFKVKYLPNFIDISSFNYSRKNVKPFSLLWVRAFSKFYNPELAILTMARLIKEFPDTQLTMIGPDKGMLNRCIILINKLNLTNKISILGKIENNQLEKYYQSHDVFMNTTSYESFGVAVFEAASCGMAIVSNNVGELSYLWKHDNNILFTKTINSKEFYLNIKQIFINDVLKVKLSQNARLNAEKFQKEEILKNWERLITTI